MRDKLTEQIIEQLDELPIVKKKAILELIKRNSRTLKETEVLQNEWKKALLTISVWTDEEIEEIYKAREYINKWKPKIFF